MQIESAVCSQVIRQISTRNYVYVTDQLDFDVKVQVWEQVRNRVCQTTETVQFEIQLQLIQDIKEYNAYY